MIKPIYRTQQDLVIFRLGDTHIKSGHCQKWAMEAVIKGITKLLSCKKNTATVRSILTDMFVTDNNLEYMTSKIVKGADIKVILQGDIFDSIVPGDKRYSSMDQDTELLTIPDAIHYAFELLKPIAEKKAMFGVHKGNHEETLQHTSDGNPAYTLALFLSSLWLSSFAYIYYVVNGKLWVEFSAHGNGGAGSIYTKIKKVDGYVSSFEGIDAYYIGHLHSCIAVSRNVLDAKYEELERRVWLCITGHFLAPYLAASMVTSNYATDATLQPSEMGYIASVYTKTDMNVMPIKIALPAHTQKFCDVNKVLGSNIANIKNAQDVSMQMENMAKIDRKLMKNIAAKRLVIKTK